MGVPTSATASRHTGLPEGHVSTVTDRHVHVVLGLGRDEGRKSLNYRNALARQCRLIDLQPTQLHHEYHMTDHSGGLRRWSHATDYECNNGLRV